MEVALRGLGDTYDPLTIGGTLSSTSIFDPAVCFASSGCRAAADIGCYSYDALAADCATWRAYTPPSAPATNLPMPVAVQPPAIDTTPGSPTYGQAIINGVAVGTPAQAQQLVDQQVAAQAAAQAAAVQGSMNTQASAQCVVQASQCGTFTSVSADCASCEFDPSKPAFLIIAAAFLMVVFAWGNKR